MRATILACHTIAFNDGIVTLVKEGFLDNFEMSMTERTLFLGLLRLATPCSPRLETYLPALPEPEKVSGAAVFEQSRDVGCSAHRQ